MKKYISMLVVAASLGMTGSALASTYQNFSDSVSGQHLNRYNHLVRNEHLRPTDRPNYLARNEHLRAIDRPGYLNS